MSSEISTPLIAMIFQQFIGIKSEDRYSEPHTRLLTISFIAMIARKVCGVIDLLFDKSQTILCRESAERPAAVHCVLDLPFRVDYESRSMKKISLRMIKCSGDQRDVFWNETVPYVKG